MRKLCTILAALTLAVLCFVLMPAEAEAAEIVASGSCGSGVTWVFDKDGTLTIYGSGSMYDYDIWVDWGGDITDVESTPWDLYTSFIKSVVIKSGVTRIGTRAFYDCVNMTNITIPSSVTSVGDAAFADCTSLTNVYITDIAAWCAIDFWDFDSTPMCQAETLYLSSVPVTGLTIPSTVTQIKDFAFYSWEDLTNVSIPASVTSIGERAFAACTAMTGIQVNASNRYYSSDSQGVLYNKAKTTLIQAPGTITSCVIPSSVTSIGQYAFRSCAALKTVTIPASVTSIGGYAFNYCHGLKGVYISDLAAWCKINFGSFSSNPLNYGNILYLNGEAVTELVIPEGITTVNDFAFFNCKSLTRVIIPEGVTEIGDKAFYNCLNMTHVAIPGTVKNIRAEAFYNTAALEKVIFCEDDSVWEKINIHSSNAHVIIAPRGHDWIKYACSVCGLERVDTNLVYFGAPGISFQDYIGMQVMFKNSVADSYDSFYVEITQMTPDGAVTTTSTGTPLNAAYRCYEQKIVSWSMTEPVTMTLCGEKNGEVYKGASFTTSVMELAMEKLVIYEFQGDITRCRIFVDMLNYGTAVQLAYDYNTSNLPNADLGVFTKYATTASPTFNAFNNIAGSNSITVLKNNISLQDRVEFQFMVKTTELQGKTVKATLAGEDQEVVYTIAGEYTIIRVPVQAAHMRDTYTIAVYDANGNPVTAIYKVSVEAYAKTQLNTAKGTALVAMMKYGDAVSKLAF